MPLRLWVALWRPLSDERESPLLLWPHHGCLAPLLVVRVPLRPWVALWRLGSLQWCHSRYELVSIHRSILFSSILCSHSMHAPRYTLWWLTRAYQRLPLPLAVLLPYFPPLFPSCSPDGAACPFPPAAFLSSQPPSVSEDAFDEDESEGETAAVSHFSSGNTVRLCAVPLS